MTLLLSFIVLILNSLVLYVVPEGRVAYWANWTFLGLTKGNWGEQHTTVGFLFLFAAILHTFYNWKPIMAYMKNKAREFKMFTAPFNIALAIVFLCVLGTYYPVPPMSTIVHISENFKDAASDKYGNPPYGHAELSSLKMLAKKEGLNLEKSMQLLKEAGIAFENEKETIKDIATKNNQSPHQIYEIIKAAAAKGSAPKKSANHMSTPLPDNPQPGWGNKKLSDICKTYGLNEKAVLAGFAAQGITAEGNSTVKEIAADNEINPMAIFEALQTVAEQK